MKTRVGMKSSVQFRDQVNLVSSWFRTWNECEQTVALYALLKKISATQAKFLLQVLIQSVTDLSDVANVEREANNPVFVSGLCNESKENAVNHLLTHLPLLQPGNTDAKQEYLNIIPKVLAHSIENGIHMEESRQLLSYSLIHPAISSEERSQFTLWLSHLEDRCTNNYSGNIYQQQRVQSQHTGLSDSKKTPLQDVSQNITPLPSYGMGDVKGSSDLVGGSNGYPTSGAQTTCLSGGPQQAVGSGSGRIGSWTSHVGMNDMKGSRDSGMEPLGRAITASNGSNLSHHHGVEHTPLHMTHSGPPAYTSQPGAPQQQQTSQHSHGHVNAHRKLTRSASVTPPMSATPTSVSDWLNSQDDMLLKNQSHQHQQHYYPHSSSLVTEGHAPLSPQSSVTSSGSGSDTHETDQHQRNTFLEDCSGMKDVPVWLKSLRLHKYAYLFQQLTYEEMMTLSETWLEQQNVTKGARHKIILSVQKLRERQNTLRLMEKEVMEMGNIKQALSELKQMLNMPMKAFTLPNPAAATLSNYSDDNALTMDKSSEKDENTDPQAADGDKENAPAGAPSGSVVTPVGGGGEGDSLPEGDLPGQICRVLGKICTQLLVSARLEDECFGLYVQLLDKCMMHEAFNQKQKKLMMSWKMQIQKVWHPPPQAKYSLDKRRSFGNTFPLNSLGNIARGAQRAVRGALPLGAGVKPPPGPGVGVAGMLGGPPGVAQPLPPHWSFSKRPPLIPPPPGAPPTPAQPGGVVGSNPVQPAAPGQPLYRNNSLNTQPYNVRSHVYELKQTVQRTHSAPIKSSQFGIGVASRPVSDLAATEPEINARLDSLCLSMTEHALGGGFNDWSTSTYNDNPADRGSTF